MPEENNVFTNGELITIQDLLLAAADGQRVHLRYDPPILTTKTPTPNLEPKAATQPWCNRCMSDIQTIITTFDARQMNNGPRMEVGSGGMGSVFDVENVENVGRDEGKGE